MPRKNPKKADEIKNKIETWCNNWKDNKNTYDEYTQFVMGNQWLDEEARVFETYKKIPLTMNKIAPLINHVLGEQRQNTPSIECVPDETVDEQTVEIREAIVKDITFESDAKVVYQTGFQCALIGGYGAWYVDTEYENDYSFNQVIRIRKEHIPTRCFWDMSATTPCKTDGMFSGFRTRMSRPKCRATWGKDIESSIPPSNLEDGSVFNDDETVTMVTYYERKIKRNKIYKLSNGNTVNSQEFKALERIMIGDDEMLMDQGQPVTIENERDITESKIVRYLYAGEYELEKEDFPSKQLPVVFVDQSSFWNKQGQQIIRPFIKDTKDAQRYINYIATQSAYLLKIGRYDQFLVSKENVRSNDTQQIWRDPVNVQGGLVFDESKSGFVPQQLKPPELSASLVQQYERALLDISSCTGMYQTQMGENGNEVSGKAIDARTKRGAYNTYLPFDSLNRAIACTASIIDEMIPFVYDTERTLMLNLKDKGVTPVDINKPMDDYQGGPVQNDMTKGRYTIRLVPGPSWEGQKQEALDSMQMVLQANPELFNMIADLYVENLPLANNIELRNRLRTIVPPEIIQAGKSGEPIPPKPEKPDPMIEIKMKELQLKQQELQMQEEKLHVEAHAKGQDIQMKWQELEAKKQEAAAQLQEMELRYMAETNRSETDQSIAHANNLVKLLTSVHKQQGAKPR